MAEPNRYSQIVSWTKVILPLLALGLLSTLFLFSSRPDPDRAIPFADVDIEELAREQRLTRPRFAGTLEDGREVLFLADRAAPVPGNAEQITAEVIEARLALSNTAFMMLTSDRSLFDLAARSAELESNVRITSTAGYRVETDLLRLSLAEMDLVAPGAVRITGPQITLTAGAMELTGAADAQVLIFNGGVRMLYDPES